MKNKHQRDRPTLNAEGPAAQEAIDAVAGFVAQLQAGWDHRDADISNQSFASDVMWGSPCGTTVQDYEELHGIHVRLKQQGKGGPSSRFEIVRVLAPAPGVAVAQVRRVALDPNGLPIEPSDDVTDSFSEMVLYVLVRRGADWWLAAGQNTPIRSAGREKLSETVST